MESLAWAWGVGFLPQALCCFGPWPASAGSEVIGYDVKRFEPVGLRVYGLGAGFLQFSFLKAQGTYQVTEFPAVK